MIPAENRSENVNCGVSLAALVTLFADVLTTLRRSKLTRSFQKHRRRRPLVGSNAFETRLASEESVVLLIAEARRLAGELAQVEEAATANDALADDFDLLD